MMLRTRCGTHEFIHLFILLHCLLLIRIFSLDIRFRLDRFFVRLVFYYSLAFRGHVARRWSSKGVLRCDKWRNHIDQFRSGLMSVVTRSTTTKTTQTHVISHTRSGAPRGSPYQLSISTPLDNSVRRLYCLLILLSCLTCPWELAKPTCLPQMIRCELRCAVIYRPADEFSMTSGPLRLLLTFVRLLVGMPSELTSDSLDPFEIAVRGQTTTWGTPGEDLPSRCSLGDHK
jgi:hypothetical protein